MPSGNTALDGDDILEAEGRVRNEMLPISRENLNWLRRIADSGENGLERDEELPTLARFLDNHLVYVHRNGEDWYDVHPLLRDEVGLTDSQDTE